MAIGNRRGATRTPPPASTRRPRPRSCVWWFLLGAMLGSFGVGLYWMRQEPGKVPASVAAIAPPERPAPPAPSFQFPNILRDTEVDISKGKPPPPPAPRPEPPPPRVEEPPAAATASATPASPPPAQEVPPAPSGSYVLQVASFKSPADAETMRGQLALLGISTRVQQATINNGQVWHRVVTGPFPSKQEMESARAQLKRHGRDSLPIKVK